jgi:two-component system NtrC family response regulator
MKSRARVLVVDDEPLMRRLVRRILVSKGYCVETSGSATDALDRLATPGFDMVITDLSMPEADGLDLLVRIKEQWPDVGVIVMTGFGDARTADKACTRGADEYITKPFNSREIEVIVERVCWRRMVLHGTRRPVSAPHPGRDPGRPEKPRRNGKLHPVV